MSMVSDGQRLAGEFFSNLHHRSLGLDTATEVNNNATHDGYFSTSMLYILYNRYVDRYTINVFRAVQENFIPEKELFSKK